MYILVAIDYYTKWVEAIPLKNVDQGIYLISYILLVVDYVSKWVEAKATRTNDCKVVVEFVRSNIFLQVWCG